MAVPVTSHNLSHYFPETGSLVLNAKRVGSNATKILCALNFRVLVKCTLGAVAIRAPHRTALVPEHELLRILWQFTFDKVQWLQGRLIDHFQSKYFSLKQQRPMNNKQTRGK